MSEFRGKLKPNVLGGKNERISWKAKIQSTIAPVPTLLDQRTAPSQYLGEDAPTSILKPESEI